MKFSEALGEIALAHKEGRYEKGKIHELSTNGKLVCRVCLQLAFEAGEKNITDELIKSGMKQDETIIKERLRLKNEIEKIIEKVDSPRLWTYNQQEVLDIIRDELNKLFGEGGE